jgi:WD40 repeat-containing protein SMU1
MSLPIEIEGGDVIRLIAQFLKENNLNNTFLALQKETQISLNTVENVDNLVSDIKNGHWDSVLNNISTLKLPVNKLIDLYEQIIIELVEMKEIDVARTILNKTGPMGVVLRQENSERWHRIDQILTRSSFDPREIYLGGSKEKRREEIADALSREVTVVPPARLLTLLGQALKYQQLQGQLPTGSSYDLFRGKAPEQKEEDIYPRRQDKVITFGEKSHPECAVFSPDGQYLVTGSVDGFIEVWDFFTGKLKHLKYQDEDKFMMHDGPVLCLGFTKDGEHLVSGDQKGKIKVWQIKTGNCLRKFAQAHTQGVTCCKFSRDGFKILTGSYDHTVRVHGLKSGNTLKVFKGHSSYVNDAIWVANGSQIASCSSDGTIKIWDAKTTECVHTFSPGNSMDIAINSIRTMPRNQEQLLVCNRSNTVYIMNLQGGVLKSFKSGKKREDRGDFLCCTVSPKGEWIYGVAEDHEMYCFSMNTGQLEHVMKVSDREVIGTDHHPHSNLICTYADDGKLLLWKP